ncbi:hypothetical protein ACQ858_13580 [Variovorax ureilyticus]|uniref:hypothetical protein n=1 Tax=Variovorax ureilyticus TaxID=1836198 RepID=UPI003D664993
MFRRLLVTLVFALPVQFIWAAVAPYCALEAEQAAFHVGHHAHASDSKAQDLPASQERDPSASADGLDHADCSQCHVSFAQFASGTRAPQEPQAEGGVAVSPSARYSSIADQNIERPKWTRAS